jgi:hypothetical protein
VAAQGPDGHADGDVRRVRAREGALIRLAPLGSRLSGLGLAAGAVLLALAVGLGAPRSLGAQVPTRPPSQPPPADTVRPRQPPGDTLRRPATPDTVRAKRDSVTVGLPAGADSSRRAGIDSVRGVPDTLKTKVRRDSIQSPLARAEAPNTLVVGAPYRWTRDSVLTSGATNLADLLERVSGVTLFRSGWLASAQTATYLGDGTRVRVFRDGVELDALDSRTGGIRDVADIQLANIDELTIERSASEIRVYIRTWTVRNTTPYTRVDAFTGDEDTNLYRFFYGRRFGSGFDAQVGVQQFGTGTRNRRTGGGGNTLDALARVGWAKKQWSVDAVYTRLDRSRDLTTTFTGQDSVLPGYEARRNEGYFRIAYGDPEGTRPWLQAIASSASERLANTRQIAFDTTRSSTGVVTAIDTIAGTDSTGSRRQYVIAGGYNLGPVRLSATDRIRTVQGTTYNTPSVRAWFGTPLLSLSGYAERGVVGGYQVDSAFVQTAFDSLVITRRATGGNDTTSKTFYRTSLGGVAAPPLRTNRIDVTGRFAPLSWFAVIGSVSRESRQFSGIHQDSAAITKGGSVLIPTDTLASSFGVTTVRLEAALRLGRMWLSGGAIRKGADTLPPLRVYECVKIPGDLCHRPQGRLDSAATALVVGARGPIYKDVYVDIAGTGWKHSGDPYRPQYQLRSEVGVLTNWIRRFPSGNFGFKFAVIDEYRSRVRFPIAGDEVPGETVCEAGLCAPPSNVLTAQLEIRIQNGTLSYQFRNALNRDYDQVPGMRMPGPINYYGVRWTFWN